MSKPKPTGPIEAFAFFIAEHPFIFIAFSPIIMLAVTVLLPFALLVEMVNEP